jgi:hypothetical protein
MKPNDIINAMHGCVFGAIMWLIFTVTFETGKWMFIGYSIISAMFLYFGIAIIFMIVFAVIGVFIGSIFDNQ